jgi:hypothetical protein
MAGRYQGYHRFADKDGEFEVYWESGWFWRPRPPEGKAVGPFVTSTEAYQNADGLRVKQRKSVRALFRRENAMKHPLQGYRPTPSLRNPTNSSWLQSVALRFSSMF